MSASPQNQRLPGGHVTQPQIAVLPEQREAFADPSTRVTHPQPAVEQAQGPHAALQGSYVNSTERVIDRLSEAAQRIAEEEQTESLLHKRPRASRLAPLRDISADIRRESTPLNSLAKPANPVPSTTLPKAPEDRIIDDATPVSGEFPRIMDTPEISLPGAGNVGTQFPAPAQESGEDLSKQMPDLWPWLLEADPDENDTDTWANRTDPLTLRHFPSSNEAARIEEEDIRRAMAEGLITAPVPQRRRRTPHKRIRIIFLLLAILAMLALIVDGILLSAALLRPHRNNNDLSGPATLTVSTPTASIGDKVIAQIRHFAPSTKVFLTHDIEEPVQTTTGPNPLQLDAHGDANVTLLIDLSWGPGFHPLVAEDVTTHYTASAQLQIIHAGETRPSHLLIDPMTNLLNHGTLLKMGSDYQGTNTIQMLTLRNSGDGTPISWAANSNRSWLMIAPTQGIFSASQTISVAVDRAHLKPGTYNDGVITFSSNVGAPPPISVEMSVKPLPPNAGPVLAVTPAVLSFTASDGGANPAPQSLTISNPGTQPLTWLLTGNNSAPVANQNSLFRALGAKANWLSTTVTSGTVRPNLSEQVQVSVNSRNLLPGTYTGMLVFSPDGKAYNTAQTVNVSLTVQPHCGLATSTGSLSFTAVAGQSNPSNQALGLSTTPGCAAQINWTAMSSASWLSVTPDSGHVNGAASAVTSVAVNASVLPPGTYNGMIAFLTGQSTQSVAVQLIVQAKPPPAAPIIAVSGLTLNFSSTQGQSTSTSQSQVVTITNNGGSALYWSTTVAQLATPWLGDSPSGGMIPPQKTGQLSVNVNTARLTPGTYVGQITLNGRDANNNTASGSPQTITVNVLVLPPCTLAQASSSALVFNAVQGGQNPGPQTVQITATGNCGWPLNISTSVSGGPSWLHVTQGSSSIAVSGQSASITVAPDITGLQAASYSTKVTIMATDSTGAQAQGSPQVFSVSLSVMQSVQPCQLSVSPTTPLAFTAPNAAAQTVTLSESGGCALPIAWTATGDVGSKGWLVISPNSGSDTGTNASFTVNVNAANLSPGSYTGQITVSAKDAGGNSLQGSPQTITVNLTVPALTVSGSVVACSDPTCATPAPLPGASVTVLISLNNSQVATTTTDSSGNYTLSLAPGTYIVNVSGTDSNGTHYSGTATLTLTASQTNFTIDAY